MRLRTNKGGVIVIENKEKDGGSPSVKDWLDSKEGQKAVLKAVKQGLDEEQRLVESRKITRKSLDVPICGY